MGAQLSYGTAGATGGGWSAQPGTLQPSYEELTHDARWCWQQRGPKTWRDRNAWRSMWSFGCRVGYGAPIGSDGAAWLDLTVRDNFEPYSCDGPGTQTLKFLKGRCVDSSDAALSGVNVQAFRTADDAFAGYEVQSRGDGSFDLPTQFGSGAHYIVAYLPGSPDRAGTTANTLTPANIDGT